MENIITKKHMENKQTAVEWLFTQLYECFEMKGDGKQMNTILERAKKMEKRQLNNCWHDGFSFQSKYKNFEEYYHETYK